MFFQAGNHSRPQVGDRTAFDGDLFGLEVGQEHGIFDGTSAVADTVYFESPDGTPNALG